mmetsp:Transcript_22888/g.37885  ORF Transcript_22888/g.37885 Transcript_22888/m.37885 type:complete len:82 (-) Transcript_22888:217-462(-)
MEEMHLINMEELNAENSTQGRGAPFNARFTCSILLVRLMAIHHNDNCHLHHSTLLPASFLRRRAPDRSSIPVCLFGGLRSV